MQSFLEEVVAQLKKKYTSFEKLVFVLPSKRAGTFIRNTIAKTSDSTTFAPEIHSIESFIEQISGIEYASNTEQLFELYRVYEQVTKGEKDDFYAFSKWAQTLLQDFNEIDRYLIASDQLFANLSAIQEIGVWSPGAERTQMMNDYVSFWKGIKTLYQNFNDALLQKGIGHQGLVYRRANERLEKHLKEASDTIHVFIGFNALNTAEEQIIQRLLQEPSTEIFWDIDAYFLNDPVHDAGYFIRNHLKKWPYFRTNSLNGSANNFTKTKKIEIIGIPKNVSQAKYVGHLLKQINEEGSGALKNTAVVLGDETLLNPILNAIPESVSNVNITMGYPLAKANLTSFFIQYINLYINRDAQGWFYQVIVGFLANPYVQLLFSDGEENIALSLIEKIKKNNWAFLTAKKLKNASENDTIFEVFFLRENPSPSDFVKKCSELILLLKEKLIKKEDAFSLEQLYRFHQLFVQLQKLLDENHFIKDMKSFYGLFKELLASETLDFQGEPLQGLQIMGMLESRNLDFETVILTSVNEGILPSGKSNNSFIPFDLKKAFKLPTYKEKDAVYTYHFYRLLQRAKNIYLIYNTEPDVLEGGEKSRLIHQLLTDPNIRSQINEFIAAPTLNPVLRTLEKIEKDDGLINLIKSHAKKGFSPTSLSNYIRNPIDFYTRNLLSIDDISEVEETVAHNTFGTIVHDSLEELYTPFIGHILTEAHLKSAKLKIKQTVTAHFSNSYADGDVGRGQNLIAFHVVVRYIENFLDMEITQVKNHEIKIIGLEQKLHTELDIPELDFPVSLTGKLDRIDLKDGVLRIIDYKTGKVELKNVEIVDWEELTTDYAYSKAFQLLCYALMYGENQSTDTLLQAGIFSFKNLKSGILSFATKDKNGRGAIKVPEITTETLDKFKKELNRLILEICDPQIPFTEKEV